MTLQINDLDYCTELSSDRQINGGVDFVVDTNIFEQRVFKMNTSVTSLVDNTTTSTEINFLSTSASSFSLAVANVPQIQANFLIQGLFSRMPRFM